MTLGDVDGDGSPELAVGAPGDDDGSPPEDTNADRGSVWILFLRADGGIVGHRKISRTMGAFDGVLRRGDAFGSSLVALGPNLLAVGAPGDDDDGPDRGALWLIDVFGDGTVRREVKISDCRGNRFRTTHFSLAGLEARAWPEQPAVSLSAVTTAGAVTALDDPRFSRRAWRRIDESHEGNAAGDPAHLPFAETARERSGSPFS